MNKADSVNWNAKNHRKSALHLVDANIDSPLRKRKKWKRIGDGSMEEKAKTITDFRIHERDTGSADVQVALLTHRINALAEHLRANKHDNHSRRGLLKMVGRRRRLLNYLSRTEHDRYLKLIAELGLRR